MFIYYMNSGHLSRKFTCRARSNSAKKLRRQHILHIAKQLILHEESHWTMALLAEASSLSKAAIYIYFKDKKELLTELLLEQLQIMQHQLQTQFSQHSPPQADRLQQLLEYFASSQLSQNTLRSLLQEVGSQNLANKSVAFKNIKSQLYRSLNIPSSQEAQWDEYFFEVVAYWHGLTTLSMTLNSNKQSIQKNWMRNAIYKAKALLDISAKQSYVFNANY